MSKVTHALALTSGCAIGYMAMAVVYAAFFWRTCSNVHEGDGFYCSNCGSHTDYKPKVPFRFCPMCGAFVSRKERM